MPRKSSNPSKGGQRERAEHGHPLHPGLFCLVAALCGSLACGDSGSGAADMEVDGGDLGGDDAGSKHPSFPSVASEAIPAPVANDCITDVTPGDHTFVCDGITYLVLVDEQCTRLACGLIFDVHGATMSGL